MHIPLSAYAEEKREHKMPRKKVIKHLKGDIKTFKHEAHEDKELIKEIKAPKKHNLRAKKRTTKVGKVMHEYKHGKLHAGSKKGPKVTNPKQAIAIGLSEARKSGDRIPMKHK